MFNKIQIERFRGIRYASIEGFKQINLFFGKNNCGKSSLLESLFLASGLSNPLLPINVNFIRDYGKSNFNDLILNFYNLDSTQPISIQMIDGEVRNLNITLFKENQENITLNTDNANILSNLEEGKYGLKLDFQINNTPFYSQLEFDSKNTKNVNRIVPNNYTESLKCVYLSPKFDFNTSIQGLKKYKKTKTNIL